MSGHHCPTCDIDVPTEARLCPQCGYVFERAAANGDGPKKRRLVLLAGVLAVLIIAAAVVWFGN